MGFYCSDHLVLIPGLGVKAQGIRSEIWKGWRNLSPILKNVNKGILGIDECRKKGAIHLQGIMIRLHTENYKSIAKFRRGFDQSSILLSSFAVFFPAFINNASSKLRLSAIILFAIIILAGCNPEK